MTSSGVISASPTVPSAEYWLGRLQHADTGYTAELPVGLRVSVDLDTLLLRGYGSHFTPSVGTDLDQSLRLMVIESAFSWWNIIGMDETGVANSRFSKLLAGFCPAAIKQTRLGRRYASAAHELTDLLEPEIKIPTIARMCGVTDRAFRNWLEGGGIRQKQNRRLMVVRALVKALVLQMGRDRALQWIQLPNPALAMTSPLDTIKAGDADRVFELAITSRPRRNRHSSLLPYVEADQADPTAQSVMAERNQLPTPEIYDLLG